jgi:hypothetical protein
MDGRFLYSPSTKTAGSLARLSLDHDGDISTGWFRDADDRAVNLLRTEGGRTVAHIGACTARAETLVRHLEQAGVDESLVNEARRLHRHLVGLHTTTTEVTR